MQDTPERDGDAPSSPERTSREDASRDAARISAEIAGFGDGTDPFAAAVRATRMPMIVTDPRQPDNPVVFANRAFSLLSGYAREDILGRNCRFLQGPETDPETIARIRAAVEAESSIEIDIRNHRKDGEPFWNRLLLAPVRDADGALAYFFASQLDVTVERERLAGLESKNAALMAELSGRLREQQESEARLRFAAAAGRLGIWELDLASEVLTASSVCKENFGRDASSPLTYEDLRDAIHPDDRDRVGAAIAASLATGAEYDIEYRVIRRDRSVGWVQVRAQVVRGSGGAAQRMAGISLDTTARRKTEERQTALLRLGDRLRELDNTAEMAFAAAEILGTTVGVSRAGYGTIDPVAETITIERDWNAPGGRSLAGTLHFRDYGSYIEDLKRGELVAFPDARVDPRTEALASALEAIGARAVLNLPIQESGGFVALLYLNNAGVHDWTPDEIGFVREVADRTRSAIERRRAENSLRELNATLEAKVEARTRERDRAWNNSQDMQVVLDPAGTFRAANEAWTAILGWRPAEVVGRSLADFVHPDDQSSTGDALAKASVAELPTYENRYRHRDGGYRWISWVAAPDDGLIFASGRHVTAEKEAAAQLEAAQDQLRQSQKMEAVGQLTGGLAHDFNNLLTGITGSLELLQTRLIQGRIGEVDRYVAAAQGAAKRAAALTHRLLAFSRRQTLDPKPTNVNRLIAGLDELIRRSVGPNVEIEVVGAAGSWTTLVDPNQLENALLNLCINARDAMPDGGRVTIETANKWLDERAGRERELAAGQYLSVCVTDTGSGMTPEVAARAFDPFFTTKPMGEGTGLGLSMIYGFARQSGGQVRIYTELGQGTTMCLYLPRFHGEETGDEAGGDETGIARSEQGETVLVVDDEPTVRMLVAEILADLGYTAIEAADGPSGLQVLRSDVRLDLMITDVGLPGGMNGRQLADAGRVERPDLKVLFITGYAENAVVRNGHLDHGMHVMAKPFAMDILASRIRELISQPGASG